ncbi:uncharacterized protein L969DRAFT_102129 [Mixia osmundae IAM 14324]|uniref:KOW domain-containing protein n=1 Tax=Mixia osmundae (strain CBS 9802 / IAM 14324 / JCM 22182 / KY 12970) TaxID=764103 RepID=G7E5U8_MIXOS|nr:uncharacterized protein L969DRAFT_102129 [Mixia osmundae IAM 14324]KEI40640.1 hypothetical protein L969DRAFT_102129 [Mixia osmundae IAM 14324]GAA98208.1 hypothetical protein E5Q_04891 [Mixia osmundae IAM 14324]
MASAATKLRTYLKGDVSIQSNFRHLYEYKGMNKPVKQAEGPTIQWPNEKHRIKFWNIHPGDQVVVREGPPALVGQVGTVRMVDRLGNRLYFHEDQFHRVLSEREIRRNSRLGPNEAIPPGAGLEPIPIHYSNVALVIGTKLSPKLDERGEAIKDKKGNPVIASTERMVAGRLKRGARIYNHETKRIEWSRIAVNTKILRSDGRLVPDLDDFASGSVIPLPTETKPTLRSPASFEMKPSEAARVTWTPTLVDIRLPENRPKELDIPEIDLGGKAFDKMRKMHGPKARKVELAQIANAVKRQDIAQAVLLQSAGRTSQRTTR